ncbi:hypothetical protein, partial [Dactylosporangium sp. NPDC005555]|uniref:hypothetical protein n=1 Tax=Dactylosporangium sp. NPDC005555 TaxID=3154889 RepID=UPI0033BE622D
MLVLVMDIAKPVVSASVEVSDSSSIRDRRGDGSYRCGLLSWIGGLDGRLRFPLNSGQGFKQLSLFLSGNAQTGRGYASRS